MLLKVLLRPDPEDGGFNVSCTAITGCHSQGDTEEEAITNIKEAITGCLAVLNERAQIRDRTEKIVEEAVN